MFRHSLLLTALALAIALPAAVSAEDAVRMQHKMKQGDQRIYRVTTTVLKKETVNKMTYTTKYESQTIDVRRFKKTDDKGNIVLETENKRQNVKLNVDGPNVKLDYKFDSQSRDNEKGSMIGALLTPVLESTSGAIFEMTVQPDGTVLPMKGYEELLKGVIKEGNPMAHQYTNEAFRFQFAESLIPLSKKPVQPGDKWERDYKLNLGKGLVMKGYSRYEYAGTSNVGKRKTVKITGTSDGSVDLDIKQAGATVTGALTIGDGTITAQFDPKAGTLISKISKTKVTGTMTVTAGDNTVEINLEQEITYKVELLDKVPK